MLHEDHAFVVIGGGPAGLAAAHEITRLGLKPVVLERTASVGGLARTENYKGFRFDMGGHRFFTKSEEVNRFWETVLLEDFLRRSRLSRIYYRKKLFYYPLRPLDALSKIGLFEAVRMMVSYLKWQIRPHRQEETFEEWVTNRFGKRMFDVFFKTYTEKVWGIPCSELKAEWAAQRIKDLSLKAVLLSFVSKPGTKIKTLIEEFRYPRLGPGMMWGAVREQVEQRGGRVRMESDVQAIRRDGLRVESVTVARNGHREEVSGTHFLSSMPLTELVTKLDPPPPDEVLRAAAQLKYRDFLTVCLVVGKAQLFPDNWIYIHDPEAKVGRIQNFKNWSPDMVPDPSKTSLGLEYFCNEGDALWSLSDDELVELAKRELEALGLARAQDVEDGCVFRVAKSYPVYDSDYREHLTVVREFVDSLANCQTIGRNGLHRYNNQDHSMLTGIYAVRNVLLGEKNDLWLVNAEEEYHEEIRSPAAEMLEQTLAVVLSKVDAVAAGVAVGGVLGGLLAFMTAFLLVKGGSHVGGTLSLLGQFLPGYRVSPAGIFTGFAYGGSCGFLAGWVFAQVSNLAHVVYVGLVRQRARLVSLRKLLEYIF